MDIKKILKALGEPMTIVENINLESTNYAADASVRLKERLQQAAPIDPTFFSRAMMVNWQKEIKECVSVYIGDRISGRKLHSPTCGFSFKYNKNDDTVEMWAFAEAEDTERYIREEGGEYYVTNFIFSM